MPKIIALEAGYPKGKKIMTLGLEIEHSNNMHYYIVNEPSAETSIRRSETDNLISHPSFNFIQSLHTYTLTYILGG